MPYPLSVKLAGAASARRKEKGKGIQLGKEEMKPSLSADNAIACYKIL